MAAFETGVRLQLAFVAAVSVIGLLVYVLVGQSDWFFSLESCSLAAMVVDGQTLVMKEGSPLPSDQGPWEVLRAKAAVLF